MPEPLNAKVLALATVSSPKLVRMLRGESVGMAETGGGAGGGGSGGSDGDGEGGRGVGGGGEGGGLQFEAG